MATADPGVFGFVLFFFSTFGGAFLRNDCLVFVRAVDGIWIHSLSRGVLGINCDSEDADVEREGGPNVLATPHHFDCAFYSD